MKDAPLLESRVCQYENSPDNNFIIDRHPKYEKVWLLGGGSGHGFKHSAALGEALAERVVDGASRLDLDPFRWSRFEAVGGTGG